MYTKILGTGRYLPKKVRTNQDLEKMVDTSDEWIVKRTGIKERRIAEKDEDPASMGYEAARQALKIAKVDKDEVELIVVATTSSTHAFPSTACKIQNMLKIFNQCPAFDISAACAGFIYALNMANLYIKSGAIKKALVIGSDVLSRSCNPKDRSTIIIFGDGAGAAVLGSSDYPGIFSAHLHSDGEDNNLLTLPNFDYRYPKNRLFLSMQGNEVFKIAVKKSVEIVQETLINNKINQSQIDWLIPHQANIRIILATARKIGIAVSKIILTLARYGNNSAASVPCALDIAIKDGRAKPNQLILLEAFGAGFVWGSALIRL